MHWHVGTTISFVSLSPAAVHAGVPLEPPLSHVYAVPPRGPAPPLVEACLLSALPPYWTALALHPPLDSLPLNVGVCACLRVGLPLIHPSPQGDFASSCARRHPGRGYSTAPGILYISFLLPSHSSIAILPLFRLLWSCKQLPGTQVVAGRDLSGPMFPGAKSPVSAYTTRATLCHPIPKRRRAVAESYLISRNC